ncbi:hypothetical protein SNE40_007678 [Patella caerulea]|uniref:G-protein coupled receptors family 1 profile domain-containing protein n=1 Tax=Patella caerulea TaxID=87958 RepID=A0AAN8JU76_PATCE
MEENSSLQLNSSDYYDTNYDTIEYVITTYVYKIVYVIGLLGNIFAVIVWSRARVKSSPVKYFIAISVADTLVLLTHALENIHQLNIQGLCQVVHLLFLAVQCFAILLVLGLSTERYIEICHPLGGDKLLTVCRTRRTIVFMAALSIVCSFMEGYIWHVDEHNMCAHRANIPSRILWIYGMCVLGILFMLPIFAILIINISVLCKVRRRRRTHSVAYSTSMVPEKLSINAAFLAISLWLAVSELCYAIVHLIQYFVNTHSDFFWNVSNLKPRPGQWHTYNSNSVPLLLADLVTLASYSVNFICFVLTSYTFRKEIRHLFRKKRRHRGRL